MAWFYLIAGGICEVVFAFFADKADGYTKLVPTILTCLAAFISIWFISMAMKTLPTGTAYAVWTGLGAVGTAVLGMVFLGEPREFWRIFFLGVIIFGVIGLNLVSGN
ncbi:DMT family transporter [Candidatus Formimonas warabiya]|uniref:DMT family transporter n=1 Tax=Formimonas warabiya TaxID=1761012 RepID=UPI001BE4920A